jgi:ribonuclease-3
VAGSDPLAATPTSEPPAALAALADRLGHRFADPELLELALSHRSWCAENAEPDSNERLEFLGDAVLGLVVTDHIFRTYPSLPEGELAKVRASVVSAPTLAELAEKLELGSAVRLGKGEDASGGREKPSILADTFEAVIGAVYLDAGWREVERMLLEIMGDRIEEASKGPGGQDYKTRLQEVVARRFDALPVYIVSAEGPDHAKVFQAQVEVDGVIRGDGRGRSKKQAEQVAARAAWRSLRAEEAEEASDA